MQKEVLDQKEDWLPDLMREQNRFVEMAEKGGF